MAPTIGTLIGKMHKNCRLSRMTLKASKHKLSVTLVPPQPAVSSVDSINKAILMFLTVLSFTGLVSASF